MPEKLAYVAIFVNFSGITFIFELKYLPKYENKKKYLLSFFYTFKLSENAMWFLKFFVTLGTHATRLRQLKQQT